MCLDERNTIKEKNYPVFTMHDYRNDPGAAFKALKKFSGPVYLTIDVDAFDWSVIPSTGTPEPGGIAYRQLVELLKRVGSKRKVIAADIMELAKIEGFHVSEYTAAKIVTKIMIHCFNGATASPATFQNEPK